MTRNEPQLADISSLTGTKLELFKLELQILTSKISSVVDTLWKIRNLSITLWVGAIAVGLGNFTPDKKPIPPLLFLAAAIPACFIIADIRNNRWYRHLVARERLIQAYLAMSATDESFLPFDSSPVILRERRAAYRWETSLFRNLADPIPLSIYGGELVFGGIAFAIYSSGQWAVVLPAVSSLGILLVVGISEVRTRRVYASTTSVM